MKLSNFRAASFFIAVDRVAIGFFRRPVDENRQLGASATPKEILFSGGKDVTI